MNCTNCNKTDIENFESPTEGYTYGDYYWCSSCGALFFVGREGEPEESYTKIPEGITEVEGGGIV